MFVRTVLALAAGLALAMPAAAQDAPAPSNVAQDGQFHVIQLTTDDGQAFEKQWRKVAAEGTPPETSTKANQPLFTYIVFSGCKANDKGVCDVSADFTIYGPDGKVAQEQRDYLIWDAKPPQKADALVLGRGALGFGTDDDGPFGGYRIVAKTTDKVAGVTVTTEQEVTVKNVTGPALPG